MSNIQATSKGSDQTAHNHRLVLSFCWKQMPHCWKSHVVVQICHLKNSHLGYDLHKSVNDRVVLTFREGFSFRETSHLRSFAKMKPSRKCPNLKDPHY